MILCYIRHEKGTTDRRLAPDNYEKITAKLGNLGRLFFCVVTSDCISKSKRSQHKTDHGDQTFDRHHWHHPPLSAYFCILYRFLCNQRLHWSRRVTKSLRGGLTAYRYGSTKFKHIIFFV